MYRNIPELIQAGVFSFKIEGRMRPADFVRRIVATYRKAIDAYIEDPLSFKVNEDDWKDLYENRARDFTTTFALGQPTAQDIGMDGTREPRFFSNAVEEPGFQDDILNAERPINKENTSRRLSVQVSDMASLKEACANGADAVYLSGEVFRPKRPWSLKEIKEAISIAHSQKVQLFVMTPRTTMRRECGELEQFLTALNSFADRPDGILVSNLGALKLVQDNTDLPVQADFSFNLFNHMSARFMKKNGITMATASLEMSFEQLRNLVEASELPIEVIIHGSYESMICDHNLPAMVLPYNHLANPEFNDRHYAMLDRANQVHPLRMDQFGRDHVLFAKDLCYYSYLDKYNGVASFRIEAKDYAPEFVGQVTKLYRNALDKLANGEKFVDEKAFADMQEKSPRQLGVGVYRFRQSQDALK